MQKQQAQEASMAGAGEPAGELPFDKYLAPYRIGPLDVLVVSMTGLDQPTLATSVRVRVDRNGNIDLPLVGQVNVLDKEVADAEEAVKSAYVPAIVRLLSVNVEVAEYYPTNVLVSGAVATSGWVPLRRSERTILHAVVTAGGVSDLASGDVTLTRVRRPGERETYRIDDPVSLAAALEANPLENGDMVFVQPAEPNTVYVGGLVMRPSPQSYAPGVNLSILQVLAAAGGLRVDVLPTEGTLIRRMPDGKDVQVKLNLDRIQSGQDPNFALAAGDILWVPDTVGTKIIDFFNRNLFIRGGVSVTYSATGQEFLNSNSRQSQLRGGQLQDTFDPFGFLTRNAALQTLATQPVQR